MNNVVGVSFKPNGKIYFFSSNGLDIKDGDVVIVDTEKGQQLANVIMANILNKEVIPDMKNVIRIATKADINVFEKNKADAMKALTKAKEIAESLDLNMNILDANYTLDRSQLLFYFLADGRVDFRDMAKELAAIYKTRIELRQIGVRDKAKEVSGIGQCGRELCCSCFLKDFMESVTINMAKNQNISLNPSKINGQCGRLLCCLNYEDDVYTENRNGMPNIGEEVDTDKGHGKVISLDILKRTYTVLLDDENDTKYEVVLPSKCDECEKCS